MHWCVRYKPIKSIKVIFLGEIFSINRPSYHLASMKDQSKVSQFELFWHLFQRMMKVPKVHCTQIIPQDRAFLFPSCGNSCISCFQISLDENSWFNHDMFLWAKIISIREESKLGVQVQSHHTCRVTHVHKHKHTHTLAFIQATIY